MGYHSGISILEGAFGPKQGCIIMVVKDDQMSEEKDLGEHTDEKN